jgi:hypothetical protein
MSARWLLAAAVLLSALAAAPPADAQAHHCGAIQLIFRNPDLQPGPDGYIRAQGQFFAQFQAIGADADKIAVFGFSFGAYTTDFSEQVCSLPSDAWFTGQQIINYRYDPEPKDGFFINLQTALVPDGEYTAAVHGYDASGTELARFWAKAIVDNCDGGTGSRCEGDAAQNQRQDKTQPWPIVLPGDGQKLDDVTGFSLEFAETLSNLTVYLNGRDVTKELEAWDGRLWDDDLIPGYGPHGVIGTVAPECMYPPVQTCKHLGEAYKWNVRPLVDADVIRVEATDSAGNKAVKSIHVGSGAQGGAITEDFPRLTANFDVTSQQVGPGDPAIFEIAITNSGGGTGHPFASSKCLPGWECRFDPVHVVVEPGKTETQVFFATPPATATTGTYTLNTTLEYAAGGDTIDINQPVKVLVNSNAPHPTTTAGAGEAKPTPAILPVLALLAAAFVLRRR